jgi:hypothetical protein
MHWRNTSPPCQTLGRSRVAWFRNWAGAYQRAAGRAHKRPLLHHCGVVSGRRRRWHHLRTSCISAKCTAKALTTLDSVRGFCVLGTEHRALQWTACKPLRQPRSRLRRLASAAAAPARATAPAAVVRRPMAGGTTPAAAHRRTPKRPDSLDRTHRSRSSGAVTLVRNSQTIHTAHATLGPFSWLM